MATMTKLCSFVYLFVLLANSEALSSTREPTIPASPGILPYVTAPDISSFFPAPSDNQPMSSGDAPSPMPSSGEFHGRMTSSSARLNYANAIVVMMLCSFFIIIKYHN
ncbi:hypothetical protein HN51_016581 [Arachis hypogaea]|nr:uncharacterized protein DS421_6g194120 [Arachis hypogaea]